MSEPNEDKKPTSGNAHDSHAESGDATPHPQNPSTEIEFFEDLEFEREAQSIDEGAYSDTTADSELAPDGVTTWLPYTFEQRRAQRLMAMVVDPDTGGLLKKARVAKLCNIHRKTLWQWMNDPRRGGKPRWYREVDRNVKEVLNEKWALLVKVQVDEALSGQAKTSAFRNIMALLGRGRPEVAIDASTNISVDVNATVHVHLPDNGRRKVTAPLVPGRLELTDAPDNGGNGGGNGSR